MLLPAKIASKFFYPPLFLLKIAVFCWREIGVLNRQWWQIVGWNLALLPWQLVLGEEGLIESDFLQDFLLLWWIDLPSSNNFRLKLFCGLGVLWRCSSAVALWYLIRCLFSLQPMSVMRHFCSDLSCQLLEMCGRLVPCPLLCPLSEAQR